MKDLSYLSWGGEKKEQAISSSLTLHHRHHYHLSLLFSPHTTSQPFFLCLGHSSGQI